MPDYVTVLAALGLLVVLLGVVLTIDFYFRQDVYERSDPISFAILLYSFLLVATDVGLDILSQIAAKEVHVPLIISGAVYGFFVFVVFQFTKSQHRQLKRAQTDKIKSYLKDLKKSTQAPDAVWTALEELGTASIEPDAFLKIKKKKKKRVEYLELIRDLTNASIDPEVDQEKLLVTEKGVLYTARVGYIVAFWFGLLSTLSFFYFFRIR